MLSLTETAYDQSELYLLPLSDLLLYQLLLQVLSIDTIDEGTKSVESIICRKGSIQNGVLKFTFPRYDLRVNVGAVSVEPELALTSWMAFNQFNEQSMVMGDLVLL